MSKRVITSSVFKVDDLISSFVNLETVGTDFPKFMNALIKGDHEAYRSGDGHEIFPVFQVDQANSPITVNGFENIVSPKFPV